MWVQKATTDQLNSFANKNKVYLYLLCYIKHQFYSRQDVLVDILLKSVKSMVNAANIQMNQTEKKTRGERNKAIGKLSTSNKDSREVLEKITEIIKSSILLEPEKLIRIEALVDQYNIQHDPSMKQEIITIEKELNDLSKNRTFFDALESMSIKLQNRVSAITKVLEFNPTTSSESLIDAINHYKISDDVGANFPPTKFLKEEEVNMLNVDNKFRLSLYKALLFVYIADAIKSGHLNLLYSYRYKAIQEYLICEQEWLYQRNKLIINAGFDKFIDFKFTMDALKHLLDEKYKITNERFLNGENIHLKINKNGKVIVSTPSTNSDDTKYISSLLVQGGMVPIIQVLADINAAVNFTACFKHFSLKYNKMKPEATTIFAGIIGEGCNIGIDKIANISVGIKPDTLKNVVNWCFSLKNIQNANDKIVRLISKLLLANNYRRDESQLHTGSDGRKVNVCKRCNNYVF